VRPQTHGHNSVNFKSCSLSLIVCFLTLMFHEVMWQHTQGVVGILKCKKTAYCKFTKESSIHFYRLRFDGIMAWVFGLTFWPTLYRAKDKSSRKRNLTGSFAIGRETSTLSLPGTNIFTVVVSFQGTKVHGNETSIIPKEECWAVPTRKLC